MSGYTCAPVGLPVCEIDDVDTCDLSLDLDYDDKAYLVAAAFVRAASKILEAAGLGGTEADAFVAYGVPSIPPDCCDAIAVGVVEFDVERDGPCWSKVSPVFELVVSTCKPLRVDGRSKRYQSAGPLDGCEPDSLNGHALRVLRIQQALANNLADMVCCYLPEFGCACCGVWSVTEVTVDNEEACTQIRYRIERG